MAHRSYIALCIAAVAAVACDCVLAAADKPNIVRRSQNAASSNTHSPSPSLLLTNAPFYLNHQLLIAVDDLRPQFGDAYGHPEVKTPNMDRFFLGKGKVMTNSYVQVRRAAPGGSRNGRAG